MYIWSKIGFNFYLLHQILSEVLISRWPNFNLFINWNRCSISLVDQMVIVTTEKSTLFYEKWTLPAAAFWLGWARMCRKNMLTGSLLVPSLLKPRALWDKELIGCSSGMENIYIKKKNPFVLLDLVLLLQEFHFKRNVKQCLYERFSSIHSFVFP